MSFTYAGCIMFGLLSLLSRRPAGQGGEVHPVTAGRAAPREPDRLLRRRVAHTAIAGLAGGMAACSVHPIPDDVSFGQIPTQEIVRSARCEMRLGLLDQMVKALRDKSIPNKATGRPYVIEDLLRREDRLRLWDTLERVKTKHELNEKFERYKKVAIAYDFDFNITEHNSAEAGLAFKLPLTSSVIDLNAGASSSLTRVGQRTFKAQEKLTDVLEDVNDLCRGFKERDQSLAYPITGSIGLRKVVETFIAISDQGGGKDSFVDTLTFTTTVRGSLASTIKIDPVPHSFRLTSASAGVGADRMDIHKVVISLAFPEKLKTRDQFVKEYKDRCQKSIATCASEANAEANNREHKLNPVWRARYNICVADGRLREDNLKTLRLAPPETYCLAYADAFVQRDFK
jgi:hypothetical protein